MRRVPPLVLAVVIVLSLVVVPLPAVGAGDHVTAANVTHVDDDDDPSTTETIGYVAGYTYDEELPVDDRDDAVVEDDELEAVVYRSMARVEVIRELPFKADVPVEVQSREEFQEESGDQFADLSDDEALYENVRYEALFMVDRDTDVVDEFEVLYGGAVAGYYDILDERIVLVSDNPDAPEVDEYILGHELLHALQDQHFDLLRFEKDTRDRAHAKDGLIEGDAVWVEEAYEERCLTEWSCLEPPAQPDGSPDLNVGMLLSLLMPYDEGPEYVDHLLEEGGWDAVNEAYDDPPTSAVEILYPDDDHDPVDVEVTDRSSEEWTPLEVAGQTATDSFGEAKLATMFVAGAFDDRQESIIDAEAFVSADPSGESYNYDHPETDGWAGDELTVYVTDAESIEETGYVWETAWVSSEEADQFAEAYLELLEINGAVELEGDDSVYVIDDEGGFPGAYAVDVDDERVTIVNAPTVDELGAIDEEAATDADPAAIEDDAGDDADDEVSDRTADTDETDATDDADAVPGFAIGSALFVLLAATLVRRRRLESA